MDDRPVKAERTLDVIIVGGSISGLLCAIVLKHSGHNVRVIEQDDDIRQSHMAGICLGPDCRKLLQDHDEISQPFSFESEKLQLLDISGKPVFFLRTTRNVTSWDALYYRLRSNFDGYASSYYPVSPQPLPQHGSAVFEARKKVIDINTSQAQSAVQVTVEDRATKLTRYYSADIVIGADGPNSFVRKQYLPHCEEKYVGYVVWRGVVREDEVSPSTLACFSKNITIFKKDRHHCLAYLIPGPNGSVRPGERYVNFAWYTNESESDLDKIMVNATTGHRHRKTVPPGQIRDEIWKNRMNHGCEIPLPPPFLEILSKIKDPFVQAITEFRSPKAVFDNEKVFLIGDGLSLLRPHTAFSATQAAFHVLTLDDVLEQRISPTNWEKTVVEFGKLHSAQSQWLGDFYQSSYLLVIASVVRYWCLSLLDRARAWFTGTPKLLRTS